MALLPEVSFNRDASLHPCWECCSMPILVIWASRNLRGFSDSRMAASSEHDDLLVALGDLVGHGLAHRHGEFAFASVAAVRFNELAGPSVKA